MYWIYSLRTGWDDHHSKLQINPWYTGYVKIAIEHGPVEIVDLPIKDGDFP
jgi:hypothetical protein